jgi:hypothetical protein
MPVDKNNISGNSFEPINMHIFIIWQLFSSFSFCVSGLADFLVFNSLVLRGPAHLEN